VHEISLRLKPNFKLEGEKIIPHPGTLNILIIQMDRKNENICHNSSILY
jgi:CTP-dependent riboflavin kinase